MGLIVQKFGGTSVANSQKILAAARKAVRAKQEGHQVVMVVSAMGKNTDHLIDLAHEVNENPPERELDMLLSTGEQVSVALMAMAINSLGYQAVSLTGGQIGIRTDSSHTKARIRSISTERMKKLLDEGNIVIAAGFQGIDENFDITTLGRGGSDTTAVALAAVLNADACEIYTDVDGVYTTDPRTLPEARLMKQVSYDEMLELASLGAGVMHNRSIEFGKKFDVPIHVRSSFSDNNGSLIVADPEAPDLVVSGAALTKDEARITIRHLDDRADVNAELFRPIAENKITVDMIVQNSTGDGKSDLSFTVPRDEFKKTLKCLQPVVERLGGTLGECSDQVSKLSVVGLGMAREVGVATRLFHSLVEAGIHTHMITTSEIKISVLIERENALVALRRIHEDFGLHRSPGNAPKDPFAKLQDRVRDVRPLEVIERLQGLDMEGLTINDISIDRSQSRISFLNLPNQLGVIAGIFESFSQNGFFVDMIVQSYVSPEHVHMSVTVPKSQYSAAIDLAGELAKQNGAELSSKESIAKLSVSGIGLRSHTGMAISMFEAFAANGIVMEMLNTSEVRVNAVVDESAGEIALESLNETFKRVLH
ncbi:MAG: aspartate kinase [Pirellulaceae bacterium]